MFHPQNSRPSAAYASMRSSADVVIADAMIQPLRAGGGTGDISAWREWTGNIDFSPDLADDIGSLRWFRGLATFAGLVILALALLPDFAPLYGAQTPLPTEAEFEEARAQMIMPLAFGADSGKRMAATDSVIALAASPERPTINLTATLGRGDSFTRVLQRAGVGGEEASSVTAMVARAADLNNIAAGTPMDITLGKRNSRFSARPLDALSFRARFDLKLAVARVNGALSLSRTPISVDNTPLRLRGVIGSSLYKSARSAGAPADAIQDFLQVIAGQTNLTNLQPTDEFDIIVEYRRAATGEVEVGDLIYAGIDRGGKAKLQMLKWRSGDTSQWFEASGVGKTQGAMGRPVAANMTSGFGMRRHPILGYRRMHSGVDFGASHGSPVYAASSGIVGHAGRKGGYGNFIRVNHSGDLATGYAHLSRYSVAAGQRVRQGQIIGYVGSTGLSTGPHLHYELYRGGRPINPLSVRFTSRAQLEGEQLARFRAKLASVKSVKPGAALTILRSNAGDTDKPKREIDRLTMRADVNGSI